MALEIDYNGGYKGLLDREIFSIIIVTITNFNQATIKVIMVFLALLPSIVVVKSTSFRCQDMLEPLIYSTKPSED